MNGGLQAQVRLKEEKKTLRVVRSMRSIDAEQWDACANPVANGQNKNIPYDPFVSHAFLLALEESQSATIDTGWAPYHLVMEDEPKHYAGVVPGYVKSHSRGEFVFDWSWADAFERAGGNYYPKYQVAVPFTPVPGRRLLVPPREDQLEIERSLLSGCVQVADQLKLSSVHVTFPNRSQWERMGQIGFMQRIDQQFHWQNKGYGTFDDFLSTLSSKKRKNIKRERRTTIDHNINVEILTGDLIKEEHWDAFFSFYMDTGSRKWGSPYLKRAFFSMIGQSMTDHILLIMCKRNGHYIAGALNFIGGDCLFGRYWGCLEDYPFLHFEICYYQAIEFAISRGLERVEAGAQGEHKLARGYLPVKTYSAHWVADPGLRDAIANYLESERRHINQDINMLAEHSPFRRSN